MLRHSLSRFTRSRALHAVRKVGRASTAVHFAPRRVAALRPSLFHTFTVKRDVNVLQQDNIVVLRELADAHPQDASYQAVFMASLHSAGLYQEILERFQRTDITFDTACANHVVQAHNALGLSYLLQPAELQARFPDVQLETTGNSNAKEFEYKLSATAAQQAQAQTQAQPQAQMQQTQTEQIPSHNMPFTPEMAQQGYQHPYALSVTERGGEGSSQTNPIYVESVTNNASSAIGTQMLVFLLKVLTITAVGAGVFYLFTEYAKENNLLSGPGGIPAAMAKNIVKPAPKTDVRMSDVKGCDEAKEELEDVIGFLKNPEKYSSLGGRMPHGVLMVGPPGTGKTMLAKAVAAEAEVPFYFTSGSEFEEMFVGVGSKRVRALFEAAREGGKGIIFIDEIDAMGSKRTKGFNSNSRATLNQLLVEMDGFAGQEGIIVIAATNDPESLDPALTRAGRFDRHVHVSYPDLKGRLEILEHYANKIKLIPTADLKTLARSMIGHTGADLATIVNDAAIMAASEDAEIVTEKHLMEARDKLSMGPALKSRTRTEKDLKITAYHEGGHAIMMLNTPGANDIHKATILARGRALGMVAALPAGNMNNVTKQQMLANMDVLMGGRVAEGMIFGEDQITTGASSDLLKAANIAKQMVTNYGFGERTQARYLDGHIKDLSSEARANMDLDQQDLIEASYKRAQALLLHKKDDLHILAQALLDKETLTGPEIDALLPRVELSI